MGPTPPLGGRQAPHRERRPRPPPWWVSVEGPQLGSTGARSNETTGREPPDAPSQLSTQAPLRSSTIPSAMRSLAGPASSTRGSGSARSSSAGRSACSSSSTRWACSRSSRSRVVDRVGWRSPCWPCLLCGALADGGAGHRQHPAGLRPDFVGCVSLASRGSCSRVICSLSRGGPAHGGFASAGPPSRRSLCVAGILSQLPLLRLTMRACNGRNEPQSTRTPSPQADPRSPRGAARGAASGRDRELAAAAAGVDRVTVWRWQRDDPDFAAAVEQADGQAETLMTRAIVDAAPRNWRAAAWWLERRRPTTGAEVPVRSHTRELARRYAEGEGLDVEEVIRTAERLVAKYGRADERSGRSAVAGWASLVHRDGDRHGRCAAVPSPSGLDRRRDRVRSREHRTSTPPGLGREARDGLGRPRWVPGGISIYTSDGKGKWLPTLARTREQQAGDEHDHEGDHRSLGGPGPSPTYRARLCHVRPKGPATPLSGTTAEHPRQCRHHKGPRVPPPPSVAPVDDGTAIPPTDAARSPRPRNRTSRSAGPPRASRSSRGTGCVRASGAPASASRPRHWRP